MGSTKIACPVCGSPIEAQRRDDSYITRNPLTGDTFELSLEVVNDYLSHISTIGIAEAAARSGRSKQYVSWAAHEGKIRSILANGRVIAVLENDIDKMRKED